MQALLEGKLTAKPFSLVGWWGDFGPYPLGCLAHFWLVFWVTAAWVSVPSNILWKDLGLEWRRFETHCLHAPGWKQQSCVGGKLFFLWDWSRQKVYFGCGFQVMYILFDGFAWSEILYTNLLEKRLQTIRSVHWRTGVDIMPRIVSSNSLAKWSSISILDHLNAMNWRFPKAFWQTATAFCSAAGAIFVKNTFTQFDGTVTIENSSAEHHGGAVHLGARSGEFRDVAWAGFEAVVGSF